MLSKLHGLARTIHINFVDESFTNSIEKIFWEILTIPKNN